MAPSKKDAKATADKPAPKPDKPTPKPNKPDKGAGNPPAVRSAVAAVAPTPATDPACPLPPKARSHVVLLDDGAKVGDRVMCENDHLLVVTQLSPPKFVKA